MNGGYGKNREKLPEDTWVVVLAAGEGSRIQGLSFDVYGEKAPKQYCHFGTSKTLLERAIGRARRLVPPRRILAVVTPHHRKWWKRELGELPEENILVQPLNRGTAAGILYPLVEILSRDRDARILFLPSDHYVSHEEILAKALRDALKRAYWREDRILILGITPERADSQYGWVEHSRESWDGVFRVRRFREKPLPQDAELLFAQGALWNSFMFHAPGRLLLKLFSEILPDLHPLLEWKFNSPDRLGAIYEKLPTFDFSRDLLEKASRKLLVYPVPQCGWSDLGTPERLMKFYREERIAPAKARKQVYPVNVSLSESGQRIDSA